jgi:WD repeat-containing protein 19
MERVQEAFDIVRNGKSAESAQMVAEYCVRQNDHRGAIEFLLMANKSEDAFKLAQSQNIVDLYCQIIGQTISTDDALKVAHYYEKSQDFGKAGR